MKYRLVVEFDTDTKTTTITDPDGEVITGAGAMLLIGNNPAEGTCYNSVFGDLRAVAESFACLSGDENPRSRAVIAHIKERMSRKHITADEALESFERTTTIKIFH